MKRLIAVVVFIFSVSLCYSQDYLGGRINECVSYISKSVPNGFHRSDRTTYINDTGDIVLTIDNGKVIISTNGRAFERTNEAHQWQAQFYEYFENNNWSYSDLSESGVEVYVKNGIYACILRPFRRDDGLIAALVMFLDDINNHCCPV